MWSGFDEWKGGGGGCSEYLISFRLLFTSISVHPSMLVISIVDISFFFLSGKG